MLCSSDNLRNYMYIVIVFTQQDLHLYVPFVLNNEDRVTENGRWTVKSISYTTASIKQIFFQNSKGQA